MIDRFGEEEKQAVAEVLEKGRLSSFYLNPMGGQKVQEFEEQFAKYIGVKNAISVSSGTTALFTSLLACGISGKSSVLTTPYTFVASASCASMIGAILHFADIDPETFNLPYPSKKWYLGISAVIPVHLLGNPCPVPEIKEWAGDSFVIEDCAQALGTKYRDQFAGQMGDLGCFSFQETKTMTTGGEGGMIVTNNDTLAEKCRRIRNHGEYYSLGEELGYNFRMTEIQAAIGIVQLKKLPRFLDLQYHNANAILTTLTDEFPDVIIPQKQLYFTKHSYFIIGTRYRGLNKEKIIKELTERMINKKMPGATVGGGYRTQICNLPYFRKYYYSNFEHTASVIEQALWFDIHRFRSLDEVEQDLKVVVEVIKKWYKAS